MAIFYGHKWSSLFRDSKKNPDKHAIMVWASTLAKHTTSESLEYCLQRIVIRYKDWPPTLPQIIHISEEFLFQQMGVPDLNAAFKSATLERGRLGADFSKTAHWTVLETVRNIDTWSFDRLPEWEAKKVFSAEWERTLSRHKLVSRIEN